MKSFSQLLSEINENKIVGLPNEIVSELTSIVSKVVPKTKVVYNQQLSNNKFEIIFTSTIKDARYSDEPNLIAALGNVRNKLKSFNDSTYHINTVSLHDYPSNDYNFLIQLTKK